jgi:hypothetical protein
MLVVSSSVVVRCYVLACPCFHFPPRIAEDGRSKSMGELETRAWDFDVFISRTIPSCMLYEVCLMFQYTLWFFRSYAFLSSRFSPHEFFELLERRLNNNCNLIRFYVFLFIFKFGNIRELVF